MSDVPVYRSPYNPGLPEVNELPEIIEAGIDSVRLQGTLAKRMPSMPGGTLQDLYGTDYRATSQRETARDVGIANEINKAYLKRSAARAKARNYSATRAAENAPRVANKSRKQQVRNAKQREKALTKYVARSMGVGPDLYRQLTRLDKKDSLWQ